MKRTKTILTAILLALGFDAPGIRAQDGIKVHGHWVVDVHNSDGTLVSHNEFENALQANGQRLLGRFLGRSWAPGKWQVTVFDGLCAPDVYLSTVCWVIESDGCCQAPNVFKNLVLDASASGQTILRGSFTAAAAGQVGSVTTKLGSCDGSIAPQSCDDGTLWEFSARTLDTPIAVQEGQIVQIKVTFSFN